jgi:cyanate permease
MRTRVRHLTVTVLSAVCLAGPISAVSLALTPAAWRGPVLVWGILLGAIALVAWLRRRRP